ncbi:MAG: recombination mediator RecR [Rickettsiales bacterium]|jgi:recombination protein RecR|nr:recombination mediator RecR [Rickettsiales bacterium]
MSQNIIDNLTQMLAKMPNMGPKMARRLVLHLAQNKESKLEPLIASLNIIKEDIHQCNLCGNIDQGYICKICNNQDRDNSVICIVEQVADLWAIERSKNYQGLYHILGGNLSAVSGKTFEDLNLVKLYHRIEYNKNLKEVIIATSATIDGQTTAYFIAENLKKFAITVTRLTHGIPIGSELDYLDDGTIAIALKTRSDFK